MKTMSELLEIRAALKHVAPNLRASDALLVGVPSMSMRGFFARADVQALQEIQKRNAPNTEAHIKATADMLSLAEQIGAETFFN